MSTDDFKRLKIDYEVLLWSIGLGIEVVGVLCAIAWAIPLILFNTFSTQGTFYDPMLAIAPDEVWGISALVAAVINIAGLILFLFSSNYSKILRVAGLISLCLFFGAIAGTMFENGYKVPSPYLHGALALSLAASIATAIVPLSISTKEKKYSLVMEGGR